MTFSFWEQDRWLQQADLMVVGAGLTGIQAALRYRQLRPSAQIVVLERGLLPSGASTKNAGFACFGSPSELLDDLATIGEAATFALVGRRYTGLRLLREQLGDQRFQYRPCGGWELFRPEDQSLLTRCLEALPQLNDAFRRVTGQLDAFAVDQSQAARCGFAGLGHSIRARLEGQLHPGAMMAALWTLAGEQNIDIRTGATVTGLNSLPGGIALEVAGLGEWQAAQVLVANNGFARQLLPDLALRAVRNQVLITEPVPGLGWEGVFHYDRGYGYARNVGDRVLMGGLRHLGGEAEETDEFGLTNQIQDRLEHFLRTVLLPGRDVKVAQRWSGILGVGESREPILQEVQPSLWVAVRLGGMGVALGSLLGKEAAETMLA